MGARRMSDEEWFTMRNERWTVQQQSAIRRELDRCRAAEGSAHSAGLEEAAEYLEQVFDQPTMAGEIRKLKNDPKEPAPVESP